MQAFWSWWQDLPAVISPYILTIGPVKLHWYGLMYVVAFTIGSLLIASRIRRGEVSLELETLQDYMTWAVLGILIGGRLGYAIFYAPWYYLAHPLQLIWPFAGGHFIGIAGMSFHGGLIGITLATILFAHRRRLKLWALIDAIVPVTPLAFMFGRIGNFLNGELWGRPTTVPWAMHFPRSGDFLLRHPSQLYEALGEGLLIFLILWPLRNRPKLKGHFLALYLIDYGIIRFLIEYVREPDRQLGNVLGPLTMGQILSIFTLICGILLLLSRKNMTHTFRNRWSKKEAAEMPKPEAPQDSGEHPQV